MFAAFIPNVTNITTGVGKAARWWRLSYPYLFIIACYLLALICYALFRLAFLIYFRDEISGAGPGEILTAFAVGIRFDQITILYSLLPILLFGPWVSLANRPVRWSVVGYLTLIFSLQFILLMIDIRFYETFGSHLNFMAYEYLNTTDEVWYLVSTVPGFWVSVIIWLVLTVAFGFLLVRLAGSIAKRVHRYSWIGQAVWMTVFFALFFLGIRGRVGLAPIDWGAAYFSQNDFINQLSLNGVYTLARNYTERDGDLRLSVMSESERFPFIESSDALDTVQVMLYQESDEWLAPEQSLKRFSTSRSSPDIMNLNVIIVLLESWSARNTGALGSVHDLTPHFDAASEKGTLFTRFYACGIRTSFGMTAVLGAYPSIPGRSIVGRYDAPHPFLTISEILHERGYYNLFVYGGDLAFDNIEGFFTGKKYDRFIGEDDFPGGQKFSKWGVPDHFLFDRVNKVLDSLPRPFQMTVLTLSNHEPYDLPDSSVRMFFDNSDSSKIFNAQLYADYALEKFLSHIEESGLLDSTIVVLTADHGRRLGGRLVLDPETFRIPMLILGPSGVIARGETVETVGSQTDIVPTLLGLLGGKYRHQSWGRDLFNLQPDDSGFAAFNAGEAIGLITGDYYYMEWLGRQAALYAIDSLGGGRRDLSQEESEQLRFMQNRLRAFMQVAEEMSVITIPQ